MWWSLIVITCISGHATSDQSDLCIKSLNVKCAIIDNGLDQTVLVTVVT